MFYLIDEVNYKSLMIGKGQGVKRYEDLCFQDHEQLAIIE